MKKRLLSLVLACCMMLGMLSGCGKEEKKEASFSGGGATLTVGIPQNFNVTSYDDNAFTKYIEESLDMNIEFVYFPSNETYYIQQLTLMATSGEKMPDVIWGFNGLTSVAVNDFGLDGFFIDLKDLIDEHATNFNAQMDALPKEERERIERKGTSEDGCFYAMPLVTNKMVDNMQHMTYINKTWLDKLGLQAPTTIEELYNVLTAFKTQDPNGNGAADEIPMLGKPNGDYDITGYLVNAFTHYDPRNSFNVKDGKLSPYYITDEYREALIYMNKLHAEGLLSDLSFSLSGGNEFANLITPTTGTPVVGIWTGHPSLFTDVTNPILKDYVALGSLNDATGKGGYTVVRNNSLYWSSAITKDCENVELAMKFLDFFYADETTSRMRFGEKGVDWEESTGKDIYGNDCIIKVLNDSAFFNGSQTWGMNSCSIFTYKNYSQIADMESNQGPLMLGTWEVMDAARLPEEKAEDLQYTSEEYSEKTAYQGPIDSHVYEQRNLFVTGEANPSSDAEWKEYIDTLSKLGMEKWNKLAQAAYDRANE